MKNQITFDFLMEVVQGTQKRKGQNGLETPGSAQDYYFGTRFGKAFETLEKDGVIEELGKKLRTELDAVARYAENLQLVLNGIKEKEDAAIAKRISNDSSQFKDYSVANLDAMIAKLQAMKEAKVV